MTEVKTIISYDPGLVTGVAVGEFSDDKPLEVLDGTVIPYETILEAFDDIRSVGYDYVVSELFVARTDNPFAPDLTGVRVEGVLELAYGPEVIWRDRTKKAQVPDQILKDHGIWFTGEQVDWEDGRDVNDAVIHMLGHVAFTLRHKPTLRKYFGGLALRD